MTVERTASPRSRGSPLEFPNGRRFAFTVIDDTDVATVANVRPLYELLYSLGMRTTKTVWPLPCPEGSKNFGTSETLADDDYRAFVVELQRRGFEITWHGATMESSERARTLRALERFRETFGAYPRIHVNHSHNRENIYWGAGRFDSALIRWLVGTFVGRPASWFTGHDQSSPYWWGDACARHFEYARNLTTNHINTARFNPSMPYRDPNRPLVPWWYSASDAESVDEFNELIHPAHVDELERDNGFCVVATHFGKGFVTDGTVNAVTRERLASLARRPGWFPTVGELLDWLRARPSGSQARDGALSRLEWRRMQWQWAWDLVVRAAKRRRR